MLPTRVGALFMDMGTGKSRVLIEIAHRRAEKWDRLFWFTPASLRENVVAQLLEHTTLQRSDIAIWRDVGARPPSKAARVHVLSIEAMSASDRTVLTYNELATADSFVAVDESAYIKGPRAARTQRLTHMSARARYRMILTGTPISQGVVDLYAQMHFLSPQILGYASFYSFAANHLEYEVRRDPRGRRYKTGRIIQSHNREYLASKIAPYTYQVRKDECLDLPEKLYETRYYTMSSRARALYQQAKVDILAIDYEEWSPIRIFHLFAKLQAITCGVVGDELVCHRRVDLLLSTVAEIPPLEPVIIWTKYRAAARGIARQLRATYGDGSAAELHGDISESERKRELGRWRAGSATYLVATQATGGHGLTLNEAAYSVFFADSFKYAERLQAEDRNHRIGQTRRTVYTSLHCMECIDDRIQSALSRKASALDEFQAHVQHYRNERARDAALKLVRDL
jgi:hypothetical protein